MRIAIDHQVTSLQDAGGMSRYHYELARHLRDHPDVQLDLLLGGHRSVLPFAQLAAHNVRVTGWHSALLAGYPRYALNAVMTSAVAPSRGRYDVYHSTYQRWEPAIRHRALVATHHDSTQERYPHLFRNAAAICARKRRLYHRADVVICVSSSARQDLLEFHQVDPARIQVVHHGVTPLLASAAGEAAGVAIPGPYVLYVGARPAYKNFSALLQAFAASPAARDLCLVAAGGGTWQPPERAAIARLGLQTRVHLLPRPADAELARLYRDAALLVYPSLYEGFGLPPLEAMSVGCPVLVSRTSALPEICGDAAFYFAPEMPGSLEEQLDRLLDDTALRQSRVQSALQWSSRYTWQSTAEATLRVYAAALGARQPGGLR